MKKSLLITLLLLSCVPAYAEWMPVYEIRQLATTIFVDPQTILKEGDRVKISVLYDSKSAQFGRGGPLLSTQARSEFDCSQVRSRVLALTDFSGNEGSGKIVYSNSAEQKWEPVVPGSVSQTLWRVACGNDKIDQLPQF